MSEFNDSLVVEGARQLLHWQTVLLLDRTKISNNEAFILDAWYKRKAPPNIDARTFFFSILKNREFLFANLLLNVFYFEAVYSNPGRLFLEHSKAVKNQLPEGVKISFIPQFSRPLACIICKNKFKDLNEHNWKSKYPKVKCNDCATQWENSIKQFDEALTACIQRLSVPTETTTPGDSFIFKSLLEGLGLLEHCKFEPRYHLSIGWKENQREWTHIDGIVTEEMFHPMFERDLIDHWVSSFYREECGSDGKPLKDPCDIDGNPLKTTKEVLIVEELKDYIVSDY